MNAKYKAEILYKDEWVNFCILNKNDEEYNLDDIIVHNLPTTLKGRFITNTIGYNPTGWFSEITIEKKNIKFTKKLV